MGLRRSRLGEYDVPGLRRLLRCVRIGLALPASPGGHAVPRPADRAGLATAKLKAKPGSDEQLTAKLAAIWAEIFSRGGRRLVERIMEDESDDMDGPGPGDDALPAECCYPGCILTGKGKDGMCVKHAIALGRKDPEAVEAARQFHAVHNRQPAATVKNWRGHPARRPLPSGPLTGGPANPEPGTRNPALALGAPYGGAREPGKENTHGGAKPPPAQPTTETGDATMGPEKITCKKCGREFDPRGYAGHEPTCKGPDGGKTGPRCPDCGKRTKNERGLRAHYAQTGHGGGGKAMDNGKLTADNARRTQPRRAEATDGPGKTGPTCPDCGKQFDGERGLNCHFGHTGHGGGAKGAAARRKQRNARRYDATGTGAVECTVCGRLFKSEFSLACHWSKSACGAKATAIDKGQLTMDNGGGRVPRSQLSTVNYPLPLPPPDNIAAAGHAFMRLAELLGLAGQVADCPHPDGHLFLNTANGKAAIVAADGGIRPAEVIAR